MSARVYIVLQDFFDQTEILGCYSTMDGANEKITTLIAACNERLRARKKRQVTASDCDLRIETWKVDEDELD